MTIRMLLVLLCLALLPLSAVEQGVPALDPVPVPSPLVPQPARQRKDDPQQDLLDRLVVRMRSIDTRMGELLHRHGGKRPAISLRDLPDLERERELRDEAWRTLREALAQIPAPGRSHHRELPDATAQAAVDDAQARELRALNALAVAEIHRELHQSATGPSGEHLRRGEAVLAQIVEEHLARDDRPRLRNLQLWFLLERARHPDLAPDERAAVLERARAQLAGLRRDYPDDLRVEAASWALIENELAETLRDAAQALP